MAHTQLTSEQRYQIRARMQTNQPATIIAKIGGATDSGKTMFSKIIATLVNE